MNDTNNNDPNNTETEVLSFEARIKKFTKDMSNLNEEKNDLNKRRQEGLLAVTAAKLLGDSDAKKKYEGDVGQIEEALAQLEATEARLNRELAELNSLAGINPINSPINSPTSPLLVPLMTPPLPTPPPRPQTTFNKLKINTSNLMMRMPNEVIFSPIVPSSSNIVRSPLDSSSKLSVSPDGVNGLLPKVGASPKSVDLLKAASGEYSKWELSNVPYGLPPTPKTPFESDLVTSGYTVMRIDEMKALDENFEAFVLRRSEDAIYLRRAEQEPVRSPGAKMTPQPKVAIRVSLKEHPTLDVPVSIGEKLRVMLTRGEGGKTAWAFDGETQHQKEENDRKEKENLLRATYESLNPREPTAELKGQVLEVLGDDVYIIPIDSLLTGVASGEAPPEMFKVDAGVLVKLPVKGDEIHTAPPFTREGQLRWAQGPDTELDGIVLAVLGNDVYITPADAAVKTGVAPGTAQPRVFKINADVFTAPPAIGDAVNVIPTFAINKETGDKVALGDGLYIANAQTNRVESATSNTSELSRASSKASDRAKAMNLSISTNSSKVNSLNSVDIEVIKPKLFKEKSMESSTSLDAPPKSPEKIMDELTRRSPLIGFDDASKAYLSKMNPAEVLQLSNRLRDDNSDVLTILVRPVNQIKDNDKFAWSLDNAKTGEALVKTEKKLGVANNVALIFHMTQEEARGFKARTASEQTAGASKEIEIEKSNSNQFADNSGTQEKSSKSQDKNNVRKSR